MENHSISEGKAYLNMKIANQGRIDRHVDRMLDAFEEHTKLNFLHNPLKGIDHTVELREAGRKFRTYRMELDAVLYEIDRQDWIDVNVALPLKSSKVEFKSVGSAGETEYQVIGNMFVYDIECSTNANIAGIGSPDRITHWKPITSK